MTYKRLRAAADLAIIKEGEDWDTEPFQAAFTPQIALLLLDVVEAAWNFRQSPICGNPTLVNRLDDTFAALAQGADPEGDG